MELSKKLYNKINYNSITCTQSKETKISLCIFRANKKQISNLPLNGQ
jgi:hypothetical protein